MSALAIAPTKTPTDVPLFSGDVLIVEDTVIIAYDLDGVVSDLGAKAVHIATTVETALEILERETVQAALVDFSLGDHTSAKVVSALETANIPFALATGYTGTDGLPAKYAHLPILTKPFTDDDIRDVLGPLLG